MVESEVRELATGRNFAALTTLFADGRPQTQMMWVDADEEHVLINTEVHRAKFANVSRDARVAVAIIDTEDPYHYAEVRGVVVSTETGDAARAHIEALAQRYTGAAYRGTIQSERVILRIEPREQRVNGPRR